MQKQETEKDELEKGYEENCLLKFGDNCISD